MRQALGHAEGGHSVVIDPGAGFLVQGLGAAAGPIHRRGPLAY